MPPAPRASRIRASARAADSSAVAAASSATSAPRGVSTTRARRASVGFDSRVTRPIRSSGASWRAIPEGVTASRWASSARRSVCAGAAAGFEEDGEVIEPEAVVAAEWVIDVAEDDRAGPGEVEHELEVR